MKIKIIGFTLLFLLIVAGVLYLRFYFTYEQKNILKREIESVTGQNLVITVFGFDGKIVKRWTDVQKITSAREGRNYTYFYTKDNKYVQIPNSVWYIAEEE